MRRLLIAALIGAIITVGANVALTIALAAHGRALTEPGYTGAHRVVWALIEGLSQ